MLQKTYKSGGGHSKLEFIDIKTNISSILSYPYTGLTRLQKTTNTQTDKHKTTKQNKTKQKLAASLLVLKIYKIGRPFFFCFKESRVLLFLAYCITMKNKK